MYIVSSAVPYPIEDAFITFRYAENVASGAGPVFNHGEPVEGYSNFLWMVQLSLLSRCGLDIAGLSRIIGILCGGVTLLLIWRIAQTPVPSSAIWSLAAPLFYLLFIPFHFYSVSGLETSQYIMLLCCAALLLSASGSSPNCFPAACFVLLLCALSRPEGVFYFIAVFGYFLTAQKSSQLPKKILICGAGLFSLLYAGFIGWRLHYYNDLLPNTYYAKACLPLYMRMALGYFSLKSWCGHYVFLLISAIAVVFTGMRSNRTPPPAIPVLFFCTAVVLSFLGCGFDWMPFYRYLLPAVAFLLIILQIHINAVTSKITTVGNKLNLITAAAAIITLLLTAEQFRQDLATCIRWGAIDKPAYHNAQKFGTWAGQHLGPHVSIAAGDVGRFGYFSGLSIIDIMGLTSKSFAHLKKRYGYPDVNFLSCSVSFDNYKKKELSLLLDNSPDYVMLYNLDAKITGSYYGSSRGIEHTQHFKSRYQYLTSFYYTPEIYGRAWPVYSYFYCSDDLSQGLLAWTAGRWGYDIFIHRHRNLKHFSIAYTPEGYIRSISLKPTPPPFH